MDDLKELRALRADAPRPDRARLAPGRRGLTEVAARGRTRLRFRADWRLGAVTATAVIGAAALLAGFLVADGGDSGGSDVGAQYHVSTKLGNIKDDEPLPDPAKVLRRAADVIEQTPQPVPHQGQYAYSAFIDAGRIDGGNSDGPQDNEFWSPYDDPSYELRSDYLFLKRLPDDPEEVLEKVDASESEHADTETVPVRDFRLLNGWAQAYPTDPRGRAMIFRAMAIVPGVTVAKTEDNLGREALAVGLGRLGHRDFSEHRLLLDPRTYEILGHQTIGSYTMPPTEDDKGFRIGDVIISEMLVDQGLVDHKGQRP